jgi:hypothetical protein
MFDVIFFLLVLIYIVVSIKADEWITISALGFKIETPEMFLKHPRAYDVLRSALFLCAIATFFAMSTRYVGGVTLVLSWLGSGWIGRRKAFNNYRRILREMMNTAEDAQEKDEYEAESKKTDQELMDRVKMSMKYGI